MKKKRIAGLMLLMPLCLLAACGGGGPATLALSANWYSKTNTDKTDFSTEKLEYVVSFQGPTSPQENDYSVEYDNGTYTTEFSTINYSFGPSSSMSVYCYKTELTISGRYTYKGTVSETFHDFVKSTVYFHTVKNNNLCPIKSEKEIVSTNPVSAPSENLLFARLHMIYNVRYNTADSATEPLKTAAISISYPDETASSGTAEPIEVDVDVNRSFFDNEQILFALRGLNMSSIATFSTIDPLTNKVADVTFAETPSATSYGPQDLTIGDAKITEEIAAYKVSFRYNTAQSGPVRTAYYAAQTSTDANKYRNVLLRLEDPIPNGYGSALIYTLKNAEFAI